MFKEMLDSLVPSGGREKNGRMVGGGDQI